jgi:hypothetical protein
MSQLPAASSAIASLPPPPRRRWGWTLLLLLAIFVSGLAIGAVGAVVYVRHQLLTAIHSPEVMPERLTQRLRRRLSLSDEQTAKVLAILQSRQRELQKIRARAQPEVEAQLNQVAEEIAAVLNPQQREKWLTGFRQMRELWMPPLLPLKNR